MVDESQLQIDEYTLVEKPALDLFDKLGYNYLDGKKLKKEPQQFFLLEILKRKIQEINPWLDEVGLNKAVREITVVQAASLVEANELLYYKLVNYTSFKQDLGFGKKSQTVKFIDFDEPEKNEFTVVNQFYVKNNDFTIIPDLVVFVNGIPLAVLECKSPNLQEPIDEAISQLFGYREKNEQFFYPNQILVALARYRATYASTFSPAKYFLEWKKSYPLNERELADWLGKKGSEGQKVPEEQEGQEKQKGLEEQERLESRLLPAQDILLYSLFSKENFLDILRSYIVFETENNGVNKKLCASWIITNLDKMNEVIRNETRKEFVSGEKFPYKGKHYRLKVVQVNEEIVPTLTFTHSKFIAHVPVSVPELDYPRIIQPLFIGFYHEKAEKVLNQRARMYSKYFEEKPSLIKVRPLKNKWGNCSKTNQLRFNWRVVMAKMSIIDYVVVHELCHTKYKDHSKAFWNEVQKILADYEERKEWLRVHGDLLKI